MEIKKTKFGEILKQERFNRQMSQEQFAAFLGVTKQAISFYERGQRSPKLITASIIAQKLGIPIETFEDEIEGPMSEGGSKKLSDDVSKHVELMLLLQKHADTIELLESLPDQKREQALDYLRFLAMQSDKT